MGPILIDFLLFLSGLGSQRGTKKRVAVQLGAHVFLGDACIRTWKDFQKVSLYAGVDVQDSAYAPTSQHEARRGGIFLSGIPKSKEGANRSHAWPGPPPHPFSIVF